MPLQYSGMELLMTLLRHFRPPKYIPFSQHPHLKERFAQISDSERDEPVEGRSGTDTLKVSSWNVRPTTHIDDVIHCIQNNPDLASSDIIALQEFRRYWKGNDVLQEIAERTRFGYVYGVEFVRIDDGVISAETGNLILSRHKVEDYGIVILSPGFYRSINYDKMIGYNMAIRARVIKNRKPVVVYSAHLELMTTMQHRRSQMKKLLKDASIYKNEPVLISLDSNLVFESQGNRTLELVKEHGFSDPFGDERQRTVNDSIARIFAPVLGGKAVLDRIMSRGITLVGTVIHYAVGVSDHYPITGEYEFFPSTTINNLIVQ